MHKRLSLQLTALLLASTSMAHAVSLVGDSGVSTTGYVEATSATGAWLATQAEAEAGTNNDQVMTPLRTKQALAAQATASVTDRLVSGTSTLVQGSSGTLVQTTTGNGHLEIKGAGANAIELGQGRTNNNYAYIDFIGDATYSDYGLRIIRDNTGANTNSWIQHRGTGSLILATNEIAPIAFYMNGIERMRVNTNGNIGIGTSNPTNSLTVSTTNSYNSVMVESSEAGTADLGLSRGGNRWWWSNRTDSFRLINTFNNGTSYGEPMFISNDGKVGLSMTPSYPLDVSGTARATRFIGDGSGLTNVTAGSATNADTVDGYHASQLLTKAGVLSGNACIGNGTTVDCSDTNIGTRDAINTRTPSGFWQTSTPTVAEGWPVDSSAWYNMIAATHSNAGNYYSMQFAGDFNNSNNIFYRNTNNSGAAGWNRLWHGGNDGAGSGLDADLLDGLDSTAFARNTGTSNFIINNSAPTFTFQDTDQRSAFIHVNDNTLYVLNSAGANQTTWTQNGSYWPLTINLANNDVTLGGNVSIPAGVLWMGSTRLQSDGNLYMPWAGDWLSNVFFRRQVNTWLTTSEGQQRFYFNSGGRTFIKAGNNDGIIASFRDSGDAERVHISHDGNIWMSRLGIWMTDWFNQSVKTDATPTFSNIYLGYMGDWLSNRLNQDVRTSASPNFSNGPSNVNINNDGGIRLTRSASSSSPDTTGFIDFMRDGSYYIRFMYQFSNNTINIMRSNSGGVNFYVQGAITGTSFNQSSDIRLKKDVRDSTYGLAEIEKLRPVTYQWKEQVTEGQKGTKLGLIAQEVEKVIPEVVATSKDASATKTVAYAELVPVLIKSVQELKSENNTLKANQAMLLQRLEHLEQQAQKR